MLTFARKIVNFQCYFKILGVFCSFRHRVMTSIVCSRAKLYRSARNEKKSQFYVRKTTCLVAVILHLLETVAIATASPSFVKPHLKAMDEAPLCSYGIMDVPCRVVNVCDRADIRQVHCHLKFVAHTSSEERIEWDYITPPMDLNLSIFEANEKDHWYFVEAVVHMEMPESSDWQPVLTHVDVSLPLSDTVIDILSDLHRLDVTLSSNVDFAGIYIAHGNTDILLNPDILWSYDWKIKKFEAECNDPNILSSSWNKLKGQFNLTHLAMKGCLLNEDVLLDHQTYLQSLELAYCNLQNLPTDFFNKISNILSLSLYSNTGNITLPLGITYLKNLQQLHLFGNVLLSSANFFPILLSLTNLQVLHLANPHITSLLLLEPILNISSFQLTTLSLSGSSLQSLHEEEIELLSKQAKLEVLDLSNNSIHSIPFNWTNLPANVKIVNLSSNFLNSIKFIFSSEVELDVIDVSNNKLNIIKDPLESGKTKFLNISHNNIITVNGLNYGSHIKHLNISYNGIQNITKHTVSSMNSLQSVDLGGNLFNCQSCNITILQKWITGNHKVKIVALNGSQDLLCSFPKHHPEKVMDIKQEECKQDDMSRNPEWTRVFIISMVISLIFLTVVLLYGYQFETCYLVRLWQNRTEETKNVCHMYRYDAFICYSNADREWVVNELMERLEGAPHFYQFCDHERDFTLGSFISQNILQAMYQSHHLLFVISETFFNSQWCMWELEIARHREFEDGGSTPILLQLTPLNHSALPDGINTLLDSSSTLSGPQETLFWDKLVNMLGPSLVNLSRK